MSEAVGDGQRHVAQVNPDADIDAVAVDAVDAVVVDIGPGHLCGTPDALRDAVKAWPNDGSLADVPVPCLATIEAQLTGATRKPSGMLDVKMRGVADEEGKTIDVGVANVVDAHVHLFPDGVFSALWRWFDAYGWPIRYKLKSPDVISFLDARGLSNIVALHYAHKPKMAASLNAYMLEVVRSHPHVVGLATVFPGEDGAAEILQAAFDAGLKGVKLHCHVQNFAADDDALEAVYEVCVKNDRPLVMHAGREPKSPHYPVDTHSICGANRVEEVLRSYPALKLVVPHLGADEFDAYLNLIERYDNLWVDTTMMAANYFPTKDVVDGFVARRSDRVLYGTDFPNLPYAWDREAKRLHAKRFNEEDLERLFSQTARNVFTIPLPAAAAS